jgi:hypothetical protein
MRRSVSFEAKSSSLISIQAISERTVSMVALNLRPHRKDRSPRRCYPTQSPPTWMSNLLPISSFHHPSLFIG